VTIDTAGLAPGVYTASLLLRTNSGRRPSIRVPVHVVVSAYRVGVNAGGGAYVDAAGDTWEADRTYVPGGWGYVNAEACSDATRAAIAGTDDDPLYQDVRKDPVEYRFDGLPPGVYHLEGRFTELHRRRRGARPFDVLVQGGLVMTAHDIAGEVGALAADDHAMLLLITDGQLSIRFVGREGCAPPVISALRVTHRPDL
jgi:hypothetical protein